MMEEPVDHDIRHPKHPRGDGKHSKTCGDGTVPPAPPPSPSVPPVTPAAPQPLVYDVKPEAASLPPRHPGAATTAMTLAKREVQLTREYLNNTKLSVNDILLRCSENNTQMTAEQYVVFMDADRTFGFAGLEGTETQQERKHREVRDETVLHLLYECIMRYPDFSVTQSMHTVAKRKRYARTEAVIGSLLKDQHAALRQSLASLSPITRAPIPPDVFSAPGAKPLPASATPTKTTATTTAQPVARDAVDSKSIPPPVATRQRRRVIDRIAASDERDDDDPDDGRRKVWCCANARMAFRKQHGDAVGECVLM